MHGRTDGRRCPRRDSASVPHPSLERYEAAGNLLRALTAPIRLAVIDLLADVEAVREFWAVEVMPFDPLE